MPAKAGIHAEAETRERQRRRRLRMDPGLRRGDGRAQYVMPAKAGIHPDSVPGKGLPSRNCRMDPDLLRGIIAADREAPLRMIHCSRYVLRIMQLPDFLRFTPVPLRAQHNGWAAALQLRFIVALARGASVDEAARTVGKTRQSAYDLRKKSGAESFAAAWDSALAFARTVDAAGGSRVPGEGVIETILVPRYYRGRLVGFVQREDLAGAMRLLGRLDRLAEKIGGGPDLRAAGERLEAFERLTELTVLTGIACEPVGLVNSGTACDAA
jgi:hypothetical protein